MAYTEEILFDVIGGSDKDIYTVEEFQQMCKAGSFIDYDGHGHPIKDGYLDPTLNIFPSQADKIPEDATHIDWYNR